MEPLVGLVSCHLESPVGLVMYIPPPPLLGGLVGAWNPFWDQHARDGHVALLGTKTPLKREGALVKNDQEPGDNKSPTKRALLRIDRALLGTDSCWDQGREPVKRDTDKQTDSMESQTDGNGPRADIRV